MRTRHLVAACLLVSTAEFSGVPSGASADDPVEVVLRAAIRAGAARPVPESWIRDEASRLARGLSAEQRQKLADDPGSASALVAPRPRSRVVAADLRSLAPTPELIGDPESDLLFVPVAPCRVIDTRFATAGLLAGNTARGFLVAGTGFADQGGEAVGCGIPLGGAFPVASAVAINFIAVAPLGAGNLRAWEFGQPAPNASVINYNVPTIANGVIVPIAGVVSQPSDLSVRADVSGTHVVADVTGYFTRVEVERLKTTVETDFQNPVVVLGDGACHEITTCTVTRPVPGTVVVMATGSASLSHFVVSGSDHLGLRLDSTNPASCSPTLDEQSIQLEVQSWVPFGDYRIPFSLNTHFNVPAGAPLTYRLGAQMSAGADSADILSAMKMTCLFVPD